MRKKEIYPSVQARCVSRECILWNKTPYFCRRLRDILEVTSTSIIGRLSVDKFVNFGSGTLGRVAGGVAAAGGSSALVAGLFFGGKKFAVVNTAGSSSSRIFGLCVI